MIVQPNFLDHQRAELLKLRARLARECATYARKGRGNGGLLNTDDTRRYRRKRRALAECDAKLRGSHTEDEWRAMLDHCGHRCVSCGCKPDSLTKDHIVPISLGGSDAITNLQPLCRQCNSTNKFTHADMRPPVAP